MPSPLTDSDYFSLLEKNFNPSECVVYSLFSYPSSSEEESEESDEVYNSIV